MSFSCKEKNDTSTNELPQNKLAENKTHLLTTLDLYELIGINYNSPKAKAFLSKLGKHEIKDYFEGKKDYVYENDGIQIRTDLKGFIKVIYCSNYEKQSYKHKSFKGKLPFKLSFSDRFDEVKSKIGEGTLFDRNGFYGRIFTWKIQDSLKLAIELNLPKEENEKIFIEMITISKTK